MINDAIEKALQIIHSRYSEHLTVESISAEIFVSPFYFSRAFQRVTGIPPSRYLKALRHFEAKRLLMTTSLTVSDVVTSVGYASVGTFSSRFLRETGMTPTQLRDPEVQQLFAAVGPRFRVMPSFETTMAVRRSYPASSRPAGSVVSRISFPGELAPADIIVGVFDSIVPQCAPVACTVLRRSRAVEVLLGRVPIGRWSVVALAAGADADSGEPQLIGVSKVFTVRPGRTTSAEVLMHTPQLSDPPIATVFAPPPSRLSAMIPTARAGGDLAEAYPRALRDGEGWAGRVMSSR
ncbi:AraC family transcriptional regulator [Amycolatopsis sp. QT-25]|uniref:helix-turn-helix transcriptional regulator n=1 Tax=Amycolatopsis sp. QT-25 TaxID=3034022 RepID=UPI0023ED192B|nr:AraC family transcriptional regulator [Amycolatopsis sp. QT-25]WET83074.1 AraC family transcriptional regulator [Amycolatopsis sp. QT-25]